MTNSPATLNRVPKVTIDFWLIKLMAVTMGETAADYLAVNLGLGLTATSLIMTAVLIGALVLQFAQKRYVPWSYWLAVLLAGRPTGWPSCWSASWAHWSQTIWSITSTYPW